MEIRLPQLGEGADSGSVASVFVKVGDTIRKDDPVIELESEKAVASIPSPAAGKVAKIHVKTGDSIKVGALLLTLDEAGAAAAPAAKAAAPAPGKTTSEPEAASDESDTSDSEPPASGAEPVAAPSLRRVARELGIDLRRIRGSEAGGRIVMSDLRAYVQRLQKQAGGATGKPAAAPAEAAAEKVDFAKWGEIARKPMTPLRQTIARRMHESWSLIPHVTQFDDADVTALMELRKKHAAAYEAKGARLTLTPFLIQALVATLKKHPLFNASLDDAKHEIVLKEYYHLGIAVDTEHGLIVPVLHDVDKKSLLELSQELETIARKAKERKLTGDDLKGQTFTISNQGGIGGAHFTPIINRPDVAILGLGRGALKPVVTKDKKIEARTLLPLCLSYDHRVADGANAARFIVDLKQAIEEFPEASAKL